MYTWLRRGRQYCAKFGANQFNGGFSSSRSNTSLFDSPVLFSRARTQVEPLTFCTSLNIPGMAEARIAKFCVVVGYIKVSALRQLTATERGVVRVTWLSLEFYIPRNISERLKLHTTNFVHGLATNLQMINCPLSGRSQGHLTHSRISHPWNISGTAKARVVKFCVLEDYVKC